MTSTGKKAVLVVAHDFQTRQWLASWLYDNGFDPVATDNWDAAGAKISGDPLLVISDIETNNSGVNRVAHSLREASIDAPVIVLADRSSYDKAVESIQEGATDYLLKPINAAELSLKLTRAINEQRLTRELKALQNEKHTTAGDSPQTDTTDEVKTLQSLEREAIISTLDRFNGVRGKTAKALGISVRTLQRKIKEYGYGNPNKSFAPTD